MWSDKQPWWVKKAKERKEEKTHYKNWCVIKLHVGHKPFVVIGGSFVADAIYEYRAVGRMNAPQYFDPETGKLKKSIEVDNLTKHEAYCVAKGLNFLDDGEIDGNY